MKLTKRKALGALLLSILAIALIGTYQGWISVPGISTWLFSPPLIPVGPDFKLLMGENMTWSDFVKWIQYATAVSSQSETARKILEQTFGKGSETIIGAASGKITTPTQISQALQALKNIEEVFFKPLNPLGPEAFGLKGWPSWSLTAVVTLPDGRTPKDIAAMVWSSSEGQKWCRDRGINSIDELTDRIRADLTRPGNNRFVDQMCMDLRIGKMVTSEKGDRYFVPASLDWRADKISLPGGVSAAFDWVTAYEQVKNEYGKEAARVWIQRAHEWYAWSDRETLSAKADPNIYGERPLILAFGGTAFWIDPVTGKTIVTLPGEGMPYKVPIGVTISLTKDDLSREDVRNYIQNGKWGAAGYVIEKVDWKKDENGNIIAADITLKLPMAQGIQEWGGATQPRTLFIIPQEITNKPEIQTLLNERIIINGRDYGSVFGFLNQWSYLGFGAPVVPDEDWASNPVLREGAIPASAFNKCMQLLDKAYPLVKDYANRKGYPVTFYWGWDGVLPSTRNRDYLDALKSRGLENPPHPGMFLLKVVKTVTDTEGTTKYPPQYPPLGGKLTTYTYVFDEPGYIYAYGKWIMQNLDGYLTKWCRVPDSESALHALELAKLCLTPWDWDTFEKRAEELGIKIPDSIKAKKSYYDDPHNREKAKDIPEERRKQWPEELRTLMREAPKYLIPPEKTTITGIEPATKAAHSHGFDPSIIVSKYSIESSKVYDWATVTSGTMTIVSGLPQGEGSWVSITFPSGQRITEYHYQGQYGEVAYTATNVAPSGGSSYVYTSDFWASAMLLPMGKRAIPLSLLRLELAKKPERIPDAKTAWGKLVQMFGSYRAAESFVLSFYERSQYAFSPLGWETIGDGDLRVDRFWLLMALFGIILIILPEKRRR
ncbi:MAG: hypothetical protein QXJ15_00690 [Candidatus Bathyarchaeia archaeon]